MGNSKPLHGVDVSMFRVLGQHRVVALSIDTAQRRPERSGAGLIHARKSPEPPVYRGVLSPRIVLRITHILEEHPDARNDYKALMARYWLSFDGLGEFLGDLPAMRAGFLAWFTGCATSPKPLQNRCMQIQRRRPDLDADNDTRQQRERQSKAGPVR
jgi:hypothetical protein